MNDDKISTATSDDEIAALRRDFENGSTIDTGERLALRFANGRALRDLADVIAKAEGK